MKLNRAELSELVWFIKTVQGWNAGGPYGDGEDIYNKAGYRLMNKILGKLTKELEKVEGIVK